MLLSHKLNHNECLTPSSWLSLPMRVALHCSRQAMLMRGDDAEQRLQAAVGYLAAAEAGKSLQLPLMLSGCMEALFSREDWLRWAIAFFVPPTSIACWVCLLLSRLDWPCSIHVVIK
jgi:hypothetical protein